MLKSLSIENIAVIEKSNIEFDKGLNVLTGETGAGKSIIVDSINAVLGERTSKELVRHGCDYGSVSALFLDINDTVKSKLDKFGLHCEDDNSLFISRKITAVGKSTCKINGCSCTVSILKEIGVSLINIHGQHDSQALLNPEYHLSFVDSLLDSKSVYNEYKASFKNLLSIRKELKELTKNADDKDKQLEILDYQIDELSKADIKIGEIDELTNRKLIIKNSQAVLDALNNCNNAISGDENSYGVQGVLQTSQLEIANVSNIDDDLKSINEKLIDINENIEVLKDLIVNKLSSIDFSPNELDNIEERLNLYNNFSNKYGENEKDMIEYLEKAVKKRDLIDNSNEQLDKLNDEYDIVYNKTVDLAEKLSLYRKQIAKQFEHSVKEQLEFLDMPKIQFVVNFEKGNLSSSGFDKSEFLISTNPGEPPKPLAKIASGGELSRIMLAIKNILANHDTVDTLIFDEVDAGVSGRASRKIGIKLKSLSKSTQVICVTHSAQIASCADSHLLIQKQFSNNRTYTKVVKLDYENRKAELARIMGGLDITDNLLDSAQDLLNEMNNYFLEDK